jgi:type II secretory ATPase GspE/PulE/Tfp pilus assembly ATPase PilB-like protein
LDGRTSLRFDGHGLDLRISIQPTIYGQSIVCRLLDQRNAGRNLRDIMMTPAVRASIDNIIREPSGLFLVTGPTGSGKTSTLYSILNELNTDDRKIQTIEDPVEYRLPLLQQVNVDQHNTFALALRAALRQDPDVILVGEIRDQETAKLLCKPR